jgi:hypothetical protein
MLLPAGGASGTQLETVRMDIMWSIGFSSSALLEALEALSTALGGRPLLPALRKLALRLASSQAPAEVARLAAVLVAGQPPAEQPAGGLEILLVVDWLGVVGDPVAASRLVTLASRVMAAPEAPASCKVTTDEIVLRVERDGSQVLQQWPDAARLPRCRQLEVTTAYGPFPNGLHIGSPIWAAADRVILDMYHVKLTEGCIPPNAAKVTCNTELPNGVNPLQLPCALKHLELKEYGNSLLAPWLPVLAPIAAQLEVLVLGTVDSRPVLLNLLRLLKAATRLYWLSVCPTTPDLLDVFEAFCCGGGMPASLHVVQLPDDEAGGEAATRAARMACIIQQHLPQVRVLDYGWMPEALLPFGVDA